MLNLKRTKLKEVIRDYAYFKYFSCVGINAILIDLYNRNWIRKKQKDPDTKKKINTI